MAGTGVFYLTILPTVIMENTVPPDFYVLYKID